MGQFRPLSARRAGPRRRGLSTFGLILIVLGLIGLLVTYSFLPGWVPRFWPLLIVVMGVVIGGMIISLYLPMFDVINLIK